MDVLAARRTFNEARWTFCVVVGPSETTQVASACTQNVLRGRASLLLGRRTFSVDMKRFKMPYDARVGTVHFIRHGDTEASGEGMFSGDLDPPLAPSGVVQAAELAKRLSKLHVEAIYVSPKLRARTTADPACRAFGLEARVEAGLREISYGSWEGRKETEIHAAERALFEAWTADPATNAPPGGESAFAIAARAMPVVEEIVRAQGDGDVLVFSHKATIRVITCALLGVPISRFRERVACGTASVTSFTFGPHGPMLSRLGEPL
jgi:alpha-ribazole phosphatase